MEGSVGQEQSGPEEEKSLAMCAFWGDVFKEVLSRFKSRIRLVLIRGRLWRERRDNSHVGRAMALKVCFNS